jgi:hypothetical protein
MTQAEAAPASVTPKYMVTEAMIDEREWKGQAPVFHVNGVAQVFFGMSASWLRLKLKADENHPDTWFVTGGHLENGKLVGGTRMNFRRADPEKSDSARKFLLSDIEPMAWSLYRFGSIGPNRLAQIRWIVEAVARLYKLLPPESGEDPEEETEE